MLSTMPFATAPGVPLVQWMAIQQRSTDVLLLAELMVGAALWPAAQNTSADTLAGAAALLGAPPSHQRQEHAQTAHRVVLAGTVARTLAQCIIHPIDTVKTRLQLAAGPAKLMQWQRAFAASRLPLAALRLPNPVVGGVKDLYLGLTAAVATTVPASAVFFATREACKQGLSGAPAHEPPPLPSPAATVLASLAAAAASAVIRVPGDVLKHRVQAYLHRDVWQAARNVLSTCGARGLFCGFTATLCRDMPEIVIQFALYDAMREFARRHERAVGQPPAFLLGAMSGAVASGVTAPIDAIKSRLQCAPATPCSTTAMGAASTRGASAAASRSSLFAGCGPRMVQNIVMSASFFALYEALVGFDEGLLRPAAPGGIQACDRRSACAPPPSGPLLLAVVKPLG